MNQKFQAWLKRTVEKNDTKSGFCFDMVIQSLIVLSLINFSIETIPDLSPRAQAILFLMRVVTIAVFTLEYLLRIWVAEKKLKFIFSFFGIIDLLAILPFYISTGIDLRSLRAFRLLRLFQAFKMVRYSRAVKRYQRALLISYEELILYLFVSLLMIYFAAAGIYFFENQAQPDAFGSVFQSLWWSVVTLTTVGYGDVYPITTGGRTFTFFLLLIALGIVSAPAGILAAALQEARQQETRAKTKPAAGPDPEPQPDL